MVLVENFANYKMGILISAHDQDTAISLNNSFQDVMIIDKRAFRKVVGVIIGDASQAVELKFYGTPEFVEDASPSCDVPGEGVSAPSSDSQSWFNLLNRQIDPASYDHDKFITIPGNNPALKERFSAAEPHSFIRIQARVTADTGTIQIFVRAEN